LIRVLLTVVPILMVVFLIVYLVANAYPHIARAIMLFGAWRPDRDDDSEGL